MDYQHRRNLIYQSIKEEGRFSWDMDSQQEEYALASLHYVTEAERQELSRATDILNRIFTKTVSIIQRADECLLAELHLPVVLRDILALQFLTDSATLIGRFDFAKTPVGLKLIEFNADTPCGIVESYYVNEKVCSFYGVKNPNAGMEKHFAEGFSELLHSYRRQGYRTDNIVFSSLGYCIEDQDNTQYVMDMSGQPASFIPLTELRLFRDGLYHQEDRTRRIDVLYRLHGLGDFAADEDEDGFPTGLATIKLMGEKKLALINPPSAFIAQIKTLMALIWGLAQQKAFYSAQELAAIEQYMLPTYFDNQFLHRKPYVVKPVLGREGAGVGLFDEHGEVIEQDPRLFFEQQPVIYQELVQLETVTAECLQGNITGSLLWGSFVINGKPSAIFARIGGKITDYDSYFIPVAVYEG